MTLYSKDGETATQVNFPGLKETREKGKTMLMIALVRGLVKGSPQNPRTVACFFCQNTDPRRNTAASILRGLIWMLAMGSAQLASIFHAMYQSKSNQLNGPNAIYALFSTLSAMLADCSRAFILIDALNECSSGTEREQLLDLIVAHAKSSKTKWLLSSRHDANIKQILMHEGQMLSLELNERHISKAVRAFIEQKTSELAKRNSYSLELTEKVKKELIAKPDSTVLWAALACKRLLKVPPRRALSTLQSIPPDLRDLCAQMLDQVFQINDEEDRHHCLRILRSVSLTFRPLSMEELITTTGLPLELLDSGLSNLIEFCGSFITVRKGIIYFVHQSARDYLLSDGAEGLFPTGFQEEHGIIVDRSLDAMSKTLRKDLCILRYAGASRRSASIDNRLRAIGYVRSFWVAHLMQYLGDISIDGPKYQDYFLDQGRVHKFLLKHLHWFEALGLIGEIDKGIMGLYSLEKKLAELPFENVLHHKRFVHDAMRAFRQCRAAVEKAPLQVYYSALIFSPEKSLVRQTFKQELGQWVSSFPRLSDNWGPCLQTLESHGGEIISVAFSPDGQLLASSSDDGSVWLWDAWTGKCLQKLEGHRGSVNSVTFLTGSTWPRALMTGVCLLTLDGHRDWVSSVTFSPDGQQLASGSHGPHRAALGCHDGGVPPDARGPWRPSLF
ncbi:uncharacterized protein Z518_10785 [Rhinocladiella mackenziei CBS 650.93]|uniref:Nephrocystin 3-like N-terminal domain-containing protein n=1 Tax=Rhinocladiella mackenziei CBS 650.93 TaxID=1442369 RepID=A0A0D2GNA2_9EURO|nr:uncharacterized protein Z518_10785 [Rhinocladiella mackenziei CBS 650.93]KIW99857.1 hypothetical protein Z518_10785 [Rhinocladiella mackenziei CBS 650.93]